jgi:hypothetical protein
MILVEGVKVVEGLLLALRQEAEVPLASQESKAGVGLRRKGKTTYLAPVGKGTIFDGREGTTFREITDGTSTTILLVDADAERAVIWTRPDDLPIDLDKPHQGLTGNHAGGFHALLADGAVRLIPRDVPAQTLRALFTKAGGEVVDWSDVRP